MEAFHKRLGRTVEVIACFDSHWNYYEEIDGRKVVKQGLPGIDLVQMPSPTPELPASNDNSGDWMARSLEPEIKLPPVEVSLPPKKPVDPQTTKLIYDRKPSGGYQSFEQFLQINADLDLDWERVKSSMKFPEVVKVNINKASITEIANALPGVGKAAAKKIDSRRKDGYTSFLELQEANKDLNLSELAWEKVRELVEF